MATSTQYFALTKPSYADDADVMVLNSNFDTIDLTMHQNRALVADPYDTTETYAEGDLCIYSNVLYKCNTDGTTGVWDSSKWDATDLATEVELAAASGGSEVEANPTGTATESLTKIGIDGTVYGLSGGGGSSTLAGLSDVSLTSPSQGQALVYDGTDWVNGNSVGGGGMYVDINTIITTLTGSGSGDDFATYTATADCYAIGTITGQTAAVQIDGTTVAYTSISGETIGVMIPVKKGQILGYRMNSSSTLTLYGIVYTTQSLQPVIYSTDEREVGVWTNGKPLYQKTVVNELTITGSWQQYVSSSGMDTIVSVSTNCVRDNEEATGAFSTNEIVPWINRNDYIQVCGTGSATSGWKIVSMTVQYTKTTDTAGSGIWAPSGIPAVHYSTTEQVVGTDENGDTVYEKTFTGTVSGSAYTIPNTSDIASIKSVTGCMSDSSYDYCLPYRDSSDYALVRLHKTVGAEVAVSSYFQSTANAYTITLRYTK